MTSGTTAVGAGLLALSGVYAWHLLAFARGFRAVCRETDARAATAARPAVPRVSVVVPARDEEATIGACLDGLLAQDYPAGRLQILVVDDDSSDATPQIVRARMAGDARLGLVQIPENRRRARAHKKAAIAKAVGQATGEIVLQTDADCQVGPAWARAMASAFDRPEVAFVSGPVAYRLPAGSGLFARLQAMDFFGVMACGAGSIGLGRPNLANGACVGYRRDVFVALGGLRRHRPRHQRRRRAADAEDRLRGVAGRRLGGPLLRRSGGARPDRPRADGRAPGCSSGAAGRRSRAATRRA